MSDRINVRMPDGTIIRNVPRGTAKADIEKRYSRAKANRAELKQRDDSWFAPVDSFVRGAADIATFGFADEIAAGADTVNPFGRNSGWRDGWSEAYNANLKRQRGIDRADEAKRPKSRFGGQVGMAILPAFATGGASLAAAPRTLTTGAKVARVAKPTALAAAQGGAYAIGSTDGDIQTRLAAAPEGALWGAGGDLVGRGLGKVASRALGGRTLSDAQRALADKGVLMTPGMRGGNIARMVEDKVLGSVPFVDQLPKQAQERSFASLRRAVADEVLAPIGQNIKSVPALADDAAAGAEFADNLAKTVYKNYDQTLEGMSLIGDDELSRRLDALVEDSSLELTADQVAVLQNNVAATKEKLSKGPLTGQALREWLGDIRGRASKMAGRESGDALWDMNSLLEDALDAQNAGNASEAYRAARQSVGNLKRYQNAASRRGAGGEFTPTQLLQAAEKRGFGTTDANVANRTAPLLDTALNAAEAMRVNTANSGTVPRALATGGLLGGGLGTAMGAIDPIYGGLLAIQSAKYLPGIDELVQSMAVNRPAWARGASNAIDNNSRALGLLGVGSALGLSQ